MMHVPVTTAVKSAHFEQRLDDLKVRFFLGYTSEEEALQSFRDLGHGAQGARIAMDYLKRTTPAYRQDYLSHHSELALHHQTHKLLAKV